jgi:hypothetical protein
MTSALISRRLSREPFLKSPAGNNEVGLEDWGVLARLLNGDPNTGDPGGGVAVNSIAAGSIGFVSVELAVVGLVVAAVGPVAAVVGLEVAQLAVVEVAAVFGRLGSFLLGGYPFMAFILIDPLTTTDNEGAVVVVI